MRGRSYRLDTPSLCILSNKSIMKMAFVLVAAVAVDIGHAQTFHKTKMLNGKRKVSVDLCFDEQSKLLTVKSQKSIVADVPYGVIDKLSYEQAAHHRMSDGAGAAGIGCVDTPAVFLTCPASFGVGAALMLTKGKNHWFYVNYKQDGVPQKLTLKLDKSEYEQVLKTAKNQTGKNVEMLARPGRRKSPFI